MRIAAYIFAFVAAAAAAGQQTINVPADHPTIQLAINAAQSGDTIVVAPGSYAGDVLLNKSITLASSHGASTTVITSTGPASAIVEIVGPNIPGMVAMPALQGFTITGAKLGVRIVHRANVLDCVFNCSSTLSGSLGAIEQRRTPSASGTGSSSIENCTFSACSGAMGVVGTKADFASSATGLNIVNCHATNCATSPNGANGGYFPIFEVNAGSVTGSTVTNSLGTGIVALTVSACISDGNFDGIEADTIVNSLSTRNFRRGILGSVVRSSTASGNGYGLPSSGYGIHGNLASADNCIIAGNVGPDIGFAPSIYFGVPPTVNHCLIGAPNGPVLGSSMVIGDPLFVDPANGKFHISPNSPARNVGSNVAAFAPFDLDGLPRISGGTVDLGCYEVPDAMFPGSGEALALYAWRNSGINPYASTITFDSGDLASFYFTSPGGALVGTYPLLAAQIFPDWLPPFAPLIPGLWLDAGAFVVYGGLPASPFFLGLPPEGVAGYWSVPPGLAGLRLRLQGFASTPFAANGLFASTNAIEFDF